MICAQSKKNRRSFGLAVCAAAIGFTGLHGPSANAATSVAERSAPSTKPRAEAPRTSPRLLFTDVVAGPVVGGPDGLGVPITIFGSGLGSSRGTSRVMIGGVEVAKYLGWGGRSAASNLETITVQPGAKVNGGRIEVRLAAGQILGGGEFTKTDGATFAVSPTGSDTACSLDRPCASISTALDHTRAGDVVLVRGGAYEESEIWIRGDQGKSGRADAPLAIKNWPGESPVFANASRPMIVDANYVTVAGLVFRNGKSMGIPDIGVDGHRGNRLVNNAFSGTIGYSAIDVHGDDHVVAANLCDVASSTVGTQGHCFYISAGSGVSVLNNVAGGAPGYGIHVFDQQRSTNDFRRTIRKLRISGNILEGSTERSGLILAMGDEGARGNEIRGVVVEGNTFTGNNHAGMVIGALVRDVQVRNNLFDENGRQGLYVADEPSILGVSVDGNRFVQGVNTACHSNCEWYPVAHVELGPKAQVTVGTNTFGPGPAVVLRGGG